MQREEILYKTSKSGTTAIYFVPNVPIELVPFLEDPAYLVFNNFNVPIALYNYQSGSTELWNQQLVNNYYMDVQLSSVTTNYVTGYSITETFRKILSPTEKANIQQRFNNNVTSTITGQTQVPVNYPTYVFFKEHEVDDMYVNIKLNRTFETLDTLSMYNKPINTIPLQEAKTGVVFGKLVAIQSLKDESGNKIRIPLKNVPIGIFNKTEDFEAPMSVDNNGDRFFMNIKEASQPSQYFDSLAYDEDQRFLKSQSQFTSMPEKFKYVTTTNDQGEFVIYNAPVGSQVMVLEVDLFKQGLTKDEIILNNFPFPTDDQANIGEFPCYYYNQVPVDVIPAWGTNQSGYTELNINVNLDLRKWATYIFAPAAYGNEKLEQTVAKNVANTLKIQVRDMTNPKFAAKTLEITQIPNDLDRRPGAKYLWFNEILTQRQQLEFTKFGCPVLKLPANLYDPNGYRTDSNGVPQSNQRGLWLAAYQFSVFVNKERCIRDTGGYSDGTNFWSHFNVNYFAGAGPTDTAPFAGLGKFPYEKPWSLTYPDQYKIPAKPTQLRYSYGGGRTYQSPYIVEEPAYADGDLVGNEVDPNSTLADVGGFGVQSTNGVWFPNQIAFVATKNYMYKYERGVRWDERYANGYEQYWTPSMPGPYASYPLIAGASAVVNGEKYQRVECGYGYFMKYRDWPRVFRVDWSADIYFYPDASSSPGVSSPGTYFGGFKSLLGYRHLTYNLDDQNFAFGFNQFVNNKISKDGIDIYRIVESGLDNVKIPENFLIPTSANLQFGGHADRCYSLYVVNNGVINARIQNKFNASVDVQNPSGGSITFYPYQYFTLNPGGLFVCNDDIGGGAERLEFEVQWTGFNFPGNDSFNSNTNKYDVCNYTIGISVGGQIDGGGNIPTGSGHVDLPFYVSAGVNPPTWYINASNTGSDPDGNGGDRQGISGWNMPSNSSIYSLYIEPNPR
jgi:hypothetical protein